MVRKLLVLCALVAMLGCQKDGFSFARRVESPNELIGGDGALGSVGDWALGNEKVRVVIQDKGWSRGFGIFGGGIIDADLVRPDTGGAGLAQRGYDAFGELFPALFLLAFDVDDQMEYDFEARESITLPGIEVINDGSDGKAAIIRTRAMGKDFMTMMSTLLGLAVPDTESMRMEVDYILEPGSRHLKIVSRLMNLGKRAIDLSGEGIASFLKADGLQVPFGDIALFGTGNNIFVPGAVSRAGGDPEPRPVGFDLRYSVEASYVYQKEKDVKLPAVPGLVADFIATAGARTSYGLAAGESDRNFVWLNRELYRRDPQLNVSRHSMLIPFIFSSFTGAYYEVPPTTFEPADPDVPGSGVYEFTKYFLIGDGDVSSIRDELFDIRGTSTGVWMGQVLDTTGAAVEGAELHVYDALKRPYSQVAPSSDGRFKTRLEPGEYYYVVTAPGRRPHPVPAERFGESTKVVIKAGDEGPYNLIRISDGGAVRVEVRDPDGRPLPAKVMLVSTYEVSADCVACVSGCDDRCDPRNNLFEFALGEHRYHTDLAWRDRKGGEYIEETLYSAADGVAQGLVRPGTYDVYVSRGGEYDLSVTRGVTIRPGGRAQVQAVLTRVVDTRNYISADFHIHSGNSLDSALSLDDRVLSGAAEGLEFMVATDHNWVTDYEPAISRNGLSNWVKGITGVELSTLEMGHFNAFPLERDMGATSHFPFVDYCYESNRDKVNQSAFDWVECSPQQLFDNLRALGPYGENDTLIQINHARDSVLGYFREYFVNPYTAEPEIPTADNYGFSELVRPANKETQQYLPEKFSYDFDVLEVFNGKRLDLLHGFRVNAAAPAEWVAKKQDPCEGGHPQNGYGKVLLEKGGYIKYPGVVDDWMNLLRRGYRYTGTANSDSHHLASEVGAPRSYVYVTPYADGVARDSDPSLVHELDIIDSVRQNRVLMTNGPFLDMNMIAGEGAATKVIKVGEEVLFSSSNVGRLVNMLFTLKYPGWMDLDHINVYANGEIMDVIDVPAHYNQQPGVREVILKGEYTFDQDVFLIAEAVGSSNMFPVITPKEDPPSNISDALEGVIGGLGATEGFGSGDGITGPGFRQAVRPYALTNPIWLDIDANGTLGDARGEFASLTGLVPPVAAECTTPAGSNGDGADENSGVDGAEESGGDGSDAQRSYRARQAHQMLDPYSQNKPMGRWDIRRIFQAHQGHAH